MQATFFLNPILCSYPNGFVYIEVFFSLTIMGKNNLNKKTFLRPASLRLCPLFQPIFYFSIASKINTMKLFSQIEWIKNLLPFYVYSSYAD